MSNFGIYLEDKLSQANFTQAEFAAKLAISPQYLSDIKRGSRPPMDAVIDGLAKYAGCDRDEAYWMAGRITPDIESLIIEMGPEKWHEWRINYYHGG